MLYTRAMANLLVSSLPMQTHRYGLREGWSRQSAVKPNIVCSSARLSPGKASQQPALPVS